MHTLIIRTRNRPDWLEKTLLDYSKQRHPYPIHVEDDSSGDAFLRNQKTVSLYQNLLDVQHYEGFGRQEDSRANRVLKTTRKSLERVKTKYYSFQSDDDLFFASFVEKSIEFLDKNLDYSCVIGPEAKVFYDNNLNVVKTSPKYWHGCSQNDPLDRVFSYALNPTLPYYGVCRTSMREHLNKVEKITGRGCFQRENTVNFEYYDEEIPWCALVYLSGKVKYFPGAVMGVRGIHDSPDRVERMHKNRKLKAYSVGPIFSLISPTAPQSILQSHQDLETLVKVCNSKYSDDVIDDAIMRFLWHFIRQYSGNGLLSPEIDFCAKKAKQGGKSFFRRLVRAIYFRQQRFSAKIALIKSKSLKIYLKDK